MEKVYEYIIPGAVITLLVGALGAWLYLTSVPSIDTKLSSAVLEEKAYLDSHQKQYADCYRTVKSNSDFSIMTLSINYSNAGVPEAKIQELENSFKNIYAQKCDPLMSEYEAKYSSYEKHKIEQAHEQQTVLDRLLRSEPKVEPEPSPIFSVYNEYSPKSLQWPTNMDAAILYTGADYEKYVEERL